MFHREKKKEKKTTSILNEQIRGAEIDPKDIVITRKLGAGCFGEVWAGELYRKAVAVKIPLIQNLDEEQLNSLRNEIKIMSDNPHPNIILFMGACTQPGQIKIVTELLDGDIENVLHSQGQKLTLFERLCLAKDAALGMNWLHCTQPQIVHRDLKTANLLYKKVGNTYQVKVCDFGLSCIKPASNRKMRDGKDGAKGTPLYMPPEVMMAQEFNEKADVYSYGICLWEFLTCRDPFPHHSDYDEFVHAICKQGERPPIPTNCLPRLRSLIEDCWHANPNKRPNFNVINDCLDEILVEAAIADDEGRQFWKKYFLKKHTVQWDTFVKAFYEWHGLPLVSESGDDSGQVNDQVINVRCFRAIVAQAPGRGEARSEVNIQWFGLCLNWFGPLHRKTNGFTILDRIRLTCENDWFHGDIETPDAQLLLQNAEAGTFLVRFSNNPDFPGAFTITRVSAPRQVSNVRVRNHPLGHFSVNDERSFESLEELVLELRTVLNLKFACVGSRFKPLFEGEQMTAAA